MANMRVVNTEWTGSCVIACDCGSEEPVEGTAFAGEIELMSCEVTSLRRENSELKDQCLEFKKISRMTADEIREDYLKLGEIMDDRERIGDQVKRLREQVIRCHTLDDERRGVIRELRKEIDRWKDLWQREWENNRGEKFSPNVFLDIEEK